MVKLASDFATQSAYSASIRAVYATTFLEAQSTSPAGANQTTALSSVAAADVTLITIHTLLSACPELAGSINQKYVPRLARFASALHSVLC